MLARAKNRLYRLLRWSERYTKTDMVYLAQSSFWLNLNLACVTVLSFILSISFANFISKEAYGTYQFALSVGSILTALTLTGMNTAITQSVARGSEGSIRSSIPIQFKYSILSFLVATVIAGYYLLRGNIIVAFSILIIGFAIPFTTTFNTYTALLSGRKDFKGAFWFGQALNFPYYLTMIGVLLFVKNPLYLVAINFILSAIIAFALYRLTLQLYTPNKIDDSATLSYGKHLSVSNFINLVAGQMDNIFVYHFIGAADLAVFAFATTIPERLNSVFKGISTAAFPRFSSQTAGEISTTILSKSLRLAAAILLSTVVYVLVAPLLFHIFFPKYTDAIALSQVYAIMLIATSVTTLPLTALTATRSTRSVYIFNTVNSVMSILIMFLMITFYGLWGLVFAKGLSGIFGFAIVLALLFKERNARV